MSLQALGAASGPASTNKWRVIEENSWGQPLAATYTCTHVHDAVHSQEPTHIHIKKDRGSSFGGGDALGLESRTSLMEKQTQG